MTTANVHEAKTNLSRLLDAAAAGEEVVITRRAPGGTVARFLITVAPGGGCGAAFGALAGQITYAEDYEHADAEIAAMFTAATLDTPA